MLRKSLNRVVLSAVVAVTAVVVQATSARAANTGVIPLTADSWDLFGWPGFGQPDFIATLTQAPDGIQFSGSGFRSTSILSSKAQWDLTNATVYLKWQANGGGTFMAISPSFNPQNTYGTYDASGYSYEFFSSSYYGGSFSTGNQWGGTLLISDNTWYYSRLTFDAIKGVYGATATQNYDNYGGAIVQSWSAYGPLSPTDLGNLQHAHVGLELVDMYAGTSAWGEVGEARVDVQSVPEPASLGLILLVGGGLLRRQRA